MMIRQIDHFDAILLQLLTNILKSGAENNRFKYGFKLAGRFNSWDYGSISDSMKLGYFIATVLPKIPSSYMTLLPVKELKADFDGLRDKKTSKTNHHREETDFKQNEYSTSGFALKSLNSQKASVQEKRYRDKKYRIKTNKLLEKKNEEKKDCHHLKKSAAVARVSKKIKHAHLFFREQIELGKELTVSVKTTTSLPLNPT